MDVVLSDDEEEIREKLSKASPAYQAAFTLLVAERLLSSLGHYLPDYWRESANDAVHEGWQCFTLTDPENETFEHACKKLHAEEIGMHENPVITHIMKVIDISVEVCERKVDLDAFFVELHHLIGVVERTATHPDLVDEAVGGEFDYLLALCDAVCSADEHTDPVRAQLVANLPHPTTTLFGTAPEAN